MKRILIGIMALLMAAVLVSGSGTAAVTYTIATDKGTYGTGEPVEVYVEGRYYYAMPHIYIMNEDGDVVATKEIRFSDPLTWVWDQIGNYGNYDGEDADVGVYEVGVLYLGVVYDPYPYMDPPQAGFEIISSQGWHGCENGNAAAHNPHCQ